MSELIDTLRRSLTLSRDLLYRHTTGSEELAKVEQLISLLSSPDALAWSLLEGMAGRVVDRQESDCCVSFRLGEHWAEMSKKPSRYISASATTKHPLTKKEFGDWALCVFAAIFETESRAIQEQRKREAGVQS